MPFSTSGLDVFFYTLAATAFLVSIMYVVRNRRTNFHYQAAHNLDEEEVGFGTEMSKRGSSSSSSGSNQSGRTQHSSEQKQRDELFEEAAVEDIEFDRDELDQLRILASVRGGGGGGGDDKSTTHSTAAAAFIDDSDDDESDDDRKDVVIDVPSSRVAVSQPTQPPLPSPHRLQHRQSASMQRSSGGGQQVERAGKDDEKEERKEAELDRHERAVV